MNHYKKPGTEFAYPNFLFYLDSLEERAKYGDFDAISELLSMAQESTEALARIPTSHKNRKTLKELAQQSISWPFNRTFTKKDNTTQLKFMEAMCLGQRSYFRIGPKVKWNFHNAPNQVIRNLLKRIDHLRRRREWTKRIGAWRAYSSYKKYTKAEMRTARLAPLSQTTAADWFHCLWDLLMEYTENRPEVHTSNPNPLVGVSLGKIYWSARKKASSSTGDYASISVQATNVRCRLYDRLWEAFFTILREDICKGHDPKSPIRNNLKKKSQ